MRLCAGVQSPRFVYPREKLLFRSVGSLRGWREEVGTIYIHQMKSSAKSVAKGLISIGFEVEQKWVTFYSKDEDSEIKEKRKQVRAYVIPSQRARVNLP